MPKRNEKNERIKLDYLTFLEQAKHLSEKTTDDVAAALDRFQDTTGRRDFAAFNKQQAIRFKKVLAEAKNPQTGGPLAKTTIHAQLAHLKAFYLWLAGQPGYRRSLSYSDAEYFNPSGLEMRRASAPRDRPIPTIEQIRHVLSVMPAETPVQRRDRAIIAFTLLSGARDDAIASLRLGHVDLETRRVFQDARTVRTKNGKTIESWLFNLGDGLDAIFRDWVAYLRADCLFGETDPLFPPVEMGTDEKGSFSAVGFRRTPWADAGKIRQIFKEAFEAAGLPYCNPHSFRKTLAILGQKECATAEELKAWSQNLGHDDMLVTLTSYGTIPAHRQAELIRKPRRPPGGLAPEGEPPQEVIKWVLDHVQRKAGA